MAEGFWVTETVSVTSHNTAGLLCSRWPAQSAVHTQFKKWSSVVFHFLYWVSAQP